MTGTNHTLAGALIAVSIPAPLVPFVAFVSHFVFDAFPHFGRFEPFGDTAGTGYTKLFKQYLILDAVLCFSALFFAWWLFPDKRIIITVGTFFSAGPDFLWLLRPRTTSKFAEKFFRFAAWIQWGERPWGWILEIIYAVIFSVLLVHFSY